MNNGTTVNAQNAGILSKRNYYGSQAAYYLYDNGSGTVLQLSTNGTDAVAAGVFLSPVLGQWNHLVYSIDTTATADNVRGYLNGASAGTASKALPGGIFAGSAELHLGNLHSGNAANFPGQIDEVRISKTVRSADWIQATHDTVAKANFATYAVDGAAPPDPPTPDPGIALSGATAEAGFSWTNATATVAGGAWTASPSIENGAYAVGPNTLFTADVGRAGYARIEFTLPGNGAVSASSLPGLLAFAVQNGERASIAAVLGDGGSIAWHGLVLENGAPAVPGTSVELPMGDAASRFFRVKVKIDLP